MHSDTSERPSVGLRYPDVLHFELDDEIGLCLTIDGARWMIGYVTGSIEVDTVDDAIDTIWLDADPIHPSGAHGTTQKIEIYASDQDGMKRMLWSALHARLDDWRRNLKRWP